MITEHQIPGLNGSALTLYGISGTLPDPEWYRNLTLAERREIWVSKLRERFGDDWRRRVEQRMGPVPTLFNKEMKLTIDWLMEGF